MKNFIKSVAGFLIVVGVLFLWINYSQISCWFNGVGGLDLLTFIITLAAFLAAAYAIWQQHEAGVKQEIIGAWQVLANKAAGNSGKIEAIQFLAKQGKSLQGIDMSKETHGEQVYLKNLNVSESELGKKADLCDANFEGANLWGAKFQGAYLTGANFKKSTLAGAGFEGVALEFVNFEGVKLVRTNLRDAQFIESDLTGVDFKSSQNFERIDAFFHRNYITNNNNYDLPKVPEGFKIDFIDKNNPEIKIITNKDGTRSETKKYFIHLVSKTQNS